MNILPFEKQVSAIAALCEGNSIRATERLIGAHRDTIMRLGLRIGQGCGRLHDAFFHDLQISVIELDELWAYIGKKQARVQVGEVAEKGDQYTFLALDANCKAILSYYTGKRSAQSTRYFVSDLRQRIINSPQITSDGFPHYVPAITAIFGPQVDFAQLVKNYRVVQGNQAQVRYSPGAIVSVSRNVVAGNPNPRRVSTSYVERTNLTVRMSQRRFTRLTNGFSKKVENHAAAIALHFMFYNFGRIHKTLRVTPAMQAGVSDHVWSLEEIAALVPEPAAKKRGPYKKRQPEISN